jgi:16S rRNA (cytosine967-C5)-methyltransferase
MGEKAAEKPILLRTIKMIADAYGTDPNIILCSLFVPMKRYYLRVNLTKIRTVDLLFRLREKGILAYSCGTLEEAIYVEIQGGEKVTAGEKIAVAEREAAERVMLGADLYMPGLKRVLNAKKGDEVTIVSEDGIPVAEGILEVSPGEVNRRSKGIGVRVLRSLYRLPKIRELEEYKLGLITDQSLPSMLLVRMLDPFPRHGVYVDMTASPGGKIGHLYEYTGGLGKYFAFDHTEKKVERLKSELRRIGADAVIALKEDSRFISLRHRDMKSNFTILDPPCSGLGNRPRLSIDLDERNIKNLISLQRQLLKEAVRITSPGGLISYSTCTLTYEENEGQVLWALENLPIEVAEPSFPFPQSSLIDLPVARFIPGVHDTIGFFSAIFRRL